MAIKTSGDISKALKREAYRAAAQPNEIYGFADYGAPWKHLNKLTHGIHSNLYSIVASRPKDGKSMLAAAWLPWIAEQAKRDSGIVRVVTLETRRRTYIRRVASILAGIIAPTRILTGFLSEEEMERYISALDWLSDLPIEVLSNEDDMTDAEAMTPGASGITYKAIEQFLWPNDTYWWLLDHIGLVYDPTMRNMTDRMVNLSMQFARFSHSRVGGMVITHLTRSSVGGGRPTIDNLANSDQLTKDGDEIFLLDRPYRHARNLVESDLAYLERINGDPASLEYVSRDGEGGIDFMIWSNPRACFSELEEQPVGHMMPRPGEETAR